MERDRFFGVGEPLIQRQRDQGIDAAAYLDLVAGLGCTAYRSWMHITEILDDPSTPNPEAVAQHAKLLDRAAELDIEVTGMSHEWFLPAGCKQRSGHAMPKRDLTPGSLYMRALEMLEESWCTMAKTFPQVKIWEIGNEWNLNAFLHPDGFLDSDMSKPFTADEKMDIAVDMQYFAARGICRANTGAMVTSFAPALSTPGLGGDMPDFLPVMYGVAWTLDKNTCSAHFLSYTSHKDFLHTASYEQACSDYRNSAAHKDSCHLQAERKYHYASQDTILP